jgi:uncharacterized cofD-like protein
MSEKKEKKKTKLQLQQLMLPGLKRWIGVMIIFGVVIAYGILLLCGVHPLFVASNFLSDVVHDAASALPHRISGVIVIILGIVGMLVAGGSMVRSILGAYLPEDRESIPEVLYKKRHLGRGPKVVVIGGGTGLSNLLKGLKVYTNNITAVVTVGDDGGSSGRLREELGVLPPGDIRNCITALADEEKLVTELFQYRFKNGGGLEGHSFGNLFLSAVFAITNGDMLEAVRVASRVLNSCGQVLPACLGNISLVAELDDGRVIHGESKIPAANGRIKRLSIDPMAPDATPAVLEAIANAELIVLGPGSLYTSVIPNLLIKGIAPAVMHSSALKIYVCNVMTQLGETTDYSAADHVEAVLEHSGALKNSPEKLFQTVLVNNRMPDAEILPTPKGDVPTPVIYDADRVKSLGIEAEPHPLLIGSSTLHHDPETLAKAIIAWFYRKKNKRVEFRDDIKGNGGGTSKSDPSSPKRPPEPGDQRSSQTAAKSFTAPV